MGDLCGGIAAKHLGRGKNEVEIKTTRKGGSCSDFSEVVFRLEAIFHADAWVGKGKPLSYQRERVAINEIRVGNSSLWQPYFQSGMPTIAVAGGGGKGTWRRSHPPRSAFHH